MVIETGDSQPAKLEFDVRRDEKHHPHHVQHESVQLEEYIL